MILSIFFILFFSHTTQHSIQNTTKQNNRHILNISRSNQKGGGEGRTIRTQKVTPLYNHVYPPKNTAKHQWSKAWPHRLVPLDIHKSLFAAGYGSNMFFYTCGVNQFWIIVFFTAVKPANNILFCIELIQRPESSLRRHKLGLTDQSIRSNDKTRFTCVHRLMTTGHSQNICRKVPDDVVLHIWQFKFD